MKNSICLIATLLFYLSFSFGQSSLEFALFELPDLAFKRIDTPKGFEAAYELRIRQPLDHEHPEKGYFYQRAFLSHKGNNRPTVLVTEGYARSKNRIYELTELLDANQIQVEHRYFGESVPDSVNWSFLNLEEVTADLHKINQLFRALYPEKWVSTGISKGGQTSIYYRYFYPDDVDVSVPYVAPLNQEYEEHRIYEFLDSIGTAECRNNIHSVQIRLLENRDDLLPLLKWYAKGKNDSFSYLSLEEAFEYAVLEYPFSFWQLGHQCENLPPADAPLEEVLENFLTVVGLDLYTDASMAAYGPHYYQAATEMGYYGFQTDTFAHLLKALPEKPHAAFVPENVSVSYSPELSRKVALWLKQSGNNMIYIYGGIDTWSATAVEVSEQTNAVRFMMEKRHHGDARIKNMSAAEKEILYRKLGEWLSISLSIPE